MNVLLWILQVVVALHTVSGALWKFSHAAQKVPGLHAIPPAVWSAMSVVELVCAVCLILPAFSKRLRVLAPLAASYLAVEMLLFSGLNVASGRAETSSLVYWLVVAAVCAFVAYGRARYGARRGSTYLSMASQMSSSE
jgi:hypothetical protein